MPRKQIPNGTVVMVRSPGHWMNGEWGIVVWGNGDDAYGVAPWDGPDAELLMYRDELRVPRKIKAPAWVIEAAERHAAGKVNKMPRTSAAAWSDDYGTPEPEERPFEGRSREDVLASAKAKLIKDLGAGVIDVFSDLLEWEVCGEDGPEWVIVTRRDTGELVWED